MVLDPNEINKQIQQAFIAVSLDNNDSILIQAVYTMCYRKLAIGDIHAASNVSVMVLPLCLQRSDQMAPASRLLVEGILSIPRRHAEAVV